LQCTIFVSGLAFDLDVSSLAPFQEWDIDKLIGFIGTYDWSETVDGTDGEIYFVSPWGYGAVTGTLKGVLVINLNTLNGFIEHAGTASPVPLPSTMLALGSGLIGLIGIKKKIAS